MSKKIKRAFAMSLGLMAPATIAKENISNRISNETRQTVESSSDRIIALCNKDSNLLKSLSIDILNKEGRKTGHITLEPLCEKHKDAYPKIFDIKEKTKENEKRNSYYKYFTSEDQIVPTKGESYYKKHIEKIRGKDKQKQNIFFTISYSSYDEATGRTSEPKYVGCVGLSRCWSTKPDLEIVVSPDYTGKRIATYALKCMVNFLNSYNFKCEDDTVNEIEAIIAKDNKGSIGMARNNSFKNIGEVKDLYESNGHESDRWNLKLNTNSVLQWARTHENDLILRCEDSYPERKMITFDEFFNHERHFSKCKKNYREIKKQISDDMNKIIDEKYKLPLQNSLASWPAAWISDDEKHMDIAIDLKKLPDYISVIRESNSKIQNAKLYIECPDVVFKKLKN